MRKFIFILLFLPTLFFAQTKKSGIWHTIRWGETLVKIALRYGVNPIVLQRVNKIKNWNLIPTGGKLWIPGAKKVSRKLYRRANFYIYIIKRGDTIVKIGRRFKVNPWYLAAANHIYDLNHIRIGQRLVIPNK